MGQSWYANPQKLLTILSNKCNGSYVSIISNKYIYLFNTNSQYFLFQQSNNSKHSDKLAFYFALQFHSLQHFSPLQPTLEILACEEQVEEQLWPIDPMQHYTTERFLAMYEVSLIRWKQALSEMALLVECEVYEEPNQSTSNRSTRIDVEHESILFLLNKKEEASNCQYFFFLQTLKDC